jgi:hypothetical protein
MLHAALPGLTHGVGTVWPASATTASVIAEYELSVAVLRLHNRMVPSARGLCPSVGLERMPADQGQQLALATLQQCRQNLRAADINMQTARHRLTGARATRANELAAMVADCLCFLRALDLHS